MADQQNANNAGNSPNQQKRNSQQQQKQSVPSPATSSVPELSDHGYIQRNVIGKGQYGVVQLVEKVNQVTGNRGVFVAKAVNVEALNANDQKLARQEVLLLQRLTHRNITRYEESFSV
jgi:hypothetical protein